MMDELLLHPQDKQALDRFIGQPVQPVILCGPNGCGKSTLAVSVARRLLAGIESAQIAARLRVVKPSNQTLSIDQIRELQEFLKLRTPGNQAIRRAIIIEDAHYLTTEAQNAFLKLLEEPPADTAIILTNVGERSLLPTIYSRCQLVVLNPPEKSAITAYFTAQGYGEQEVAQAFALSQGYVGLLTSLLKDSRDHTLVQDIALGKAILQETRFDRLSRVDALSKDKHRVHGLLTALQKIARAAMGVAGNQGKETELTKWHQVAAAVYDANAKLRQNVNLKLLLTDLFIAI